jgi:hypothetical protein
MNLYIIVQLIFTHSYNLKAQKIKKNLYGEDTQKNQGDALCGQRGRIPIAQGRLESSKNFR